MAAGSTYTPIATYTVASAANNYTLSVIPSTYTDIVLVMNYSLSIGSSSTFMRFNGDTATNYSDTYMFGSSTASSNRDSNSSNGIRISAFSSGSADNAMKTTIISIQNYANATTYKTALVRDNQAGVEVGAAVGLWRKTPEAISSIYLWNGASANFNVGSTFTLYGIAKA